MDRFDATAYWTDCARKIPREVEAVLSEVSTADVRPQVHDVLPGISPPLPASDAMQRLPTMGELIYLYCHKRFLLT